MGVNDVYGDYMGVSVGDVRAECLDFQSLRSLRSAGYDFHNVNSDNYFSVEP